MPASTISAKATCSPSGSSTASDATPNTCSRWWTSLTSRGIGFRSLTEGLHTEGPMGTAMLTIMAAFAQLERDTMIERTRAGLAAAAANGRKGGRPRKIDDADAAKARQLREKGIAATDIAKMLGVSRATVYRYLADGAWLAR